jgi:cysteine-rich repeat protein
MKRPSTRVRTSLVALTAWVALGGAATADAAVEKASGACRATIQRELVRLVQIGLAAADRCHRTQNRRRADAGRCNVIGSSLFDPRGRYAGAKARALGRIGGRCAASDPVLANYEAGSVAEAVLPLVDDAVAGNSILTLGNANLGGDRKKVRCITTIGRHRSAIVNDIVGRAIRCQARADRRAAALGEIDARCVGSAARLAARAASQIGRACGGLADLGNCAPLPDCATEASRLAAQGLARGIHRAVSSTVCGDGIKEGDEQCDDGNVGAGDGCNARCELEGQSCEPVIGGRRVRVALDVPAGRALAGLRLDLDYPQFEAGLPGTGTSSIVRGQVRVLQGSADQHLVVANDLRAGDRDSSLTVVLAGTGAITSGPLLDLEMESCVALGQNICNRNPNVYGCCPNGDVPVCTGGANAGGACTTSADCPSSTCSSCFANPVSCTSFDPTNAAPGVGPGASGCCPSDNACTSQTLATSCAVSSPVDAQGQPVDGVSCSLSVSGT